MMDSPMTDKSPDGLFDSLARSDRQTEIIYDVEPNVTHGTKVPRRRNSLLGMTEQQREGGGLVSLSLKELGLEPLLEALDVDPAQLEDPPATAEESVRWGLMKWESRMRLGTPQLQTEESFHTWWEAVVLTAKKVQIPAPTLVDLLGTQDSPGLTACLAGLRECARTTNI